MTTIANASQYRYIRLMIVCVCNAIRESDVRQAAREGASCPSSAYGRFGRKPRCGQCFSFAREVIAATQAAG
jgi:bacterioferritin-associated ferredoxin